MFKDEPKITQAGAGGMEAHASGMFLRSRFRTMSPGLVAALALGTLLALVCRTRLFGTTIAVEQNPLLKAGYVGTPICAECHPGIYASFSRTDMGRSMSEITPSLLERVR